MAQILEAFYEFSNVGSYIISMKRSLTFSKDRETQSIRSAIGYHNLDPAGLSTSFASSYLLPLEKNFELNGSKFL
jgi:hypothetical protein